MFFIILTLLHRYSFWRINNTAFESIVGKGDIAHNQQFLLFPQCFLLNQIIVSPFVDIFDIISFVVAVLEKPKAGISSKGLKEDYTFSATFQ